MLDDVHNIITMEIAITRTAKYKICFLPVVILDSFFFAKCYDPELEEFVLVEKKVKKKITVCSSRVTEWLRVEGTSGVPELGTLLQVWPPQG